MRPAVFICWSGLGPFHTPARYIWTTYLADIAVAVFVANEGSVARECNSYNNRGSVPFKRGQYKRRRPTDIPRLSDEPLDHALNAIIVESVLVFVNDHDPLFDRGTWPPQLLLGHVPSPVPWSLKRKSVSAVRDPERLK